MRFSYYRRKLKVLGITGESQFKKALKLRSNRISRTAAEKSHRKAPDNKTSAIRRHYLSLVLARPMLANTVRNVNPVR